MHQRSADHGAVDHAAGDDDIGAQLQGFGNAWRTEVGVGGNAHRRQRRAVEHIGNARQLFQSGLQIVAQQDGNFQRNVGLVTGCLQCGGASLGVYAAGIADHADALALEIAQQRREHLDEIGGVAGLGIFHSCAGKDRHRDFRQVVEDQVIQCAAVHQLGGGGAGIAPEGAGTADTNRLAHEKSFLEWLVSRLPSKRLVCKLRSQVLPKRLLGWRPRPKLPPKTSLEVEESSMDEHKALRVMRTMVDGGHLTDPDSARGKLLQTAAHLFRNKGFERTTVRDLASAVGIQSGSIFHHFKSKDEILRAVMEETIHYNTAMMRASLEEANTVRERVLALIRCELQSIMGGSGEAMAVLVYEWRSLSAEGQAQVLALRDVYETIWLQVLGEAKAAGYIKGDVFITRRFLTGALSWTTTWFRAEGSLTLEQLAEEALLMVLKAD